MKMTYAGTHKSNGSQSPSMSRPIYGNPMTKTTNIKE